MDINDYYIRLERKRKTAFISRVLERCDIAYPTFMRKIKDDSWGKLEREAIEQIIKEDKNERSGIL